MRLGFKSKVLLDVIMTAGLDAMSVCTFPTSSLMKAGGWEEVRYMARHLKAMKDEGWIVWDDSKETGKWVLKITRAGTNVLTGDIDPLTSWSREWDGRWRIVGFDLPARHQVRRKELIAWLHAHRFGRLQDSLWITPCFDESWHADLAKLKIDPSAVSFMEGCSFSRSKDSDFVEKAWDFKNINRLYKTLLDMHANVTGTIRESNSWVRNESDLWREVFEKDPFLPDTLLPKGYLGKKAYASRRKRYAELLFK